MSLLADKSSAILALEGAKSSGGTRREIMTLASQAASLETRLAEELLVDERGAEAGISFLSAASCMKDARRWVEAYRLLERAEVYASTEALLKTIAQEKASIPDQEPAAAIFRNATVRIKDNPLLRIPQREAYMAAHAHFRQSSEHAIVQLPVGCGKTGTMAVLPFGLATGRTLVITPNLEIRDTVSKSLDHSSLDSFYRKTGVLDNGRGPASAVLDADANVLDADAADFVVANIHQLAGSAGSRWLGSFPPDYFDLILVDEGHHNVAESWQNVFEQFPTARVTSFTATPLRSDGKEVQGRRIYRFPISEAIREGYIRDLASRRLEPQQIYFEYEGSRHRHTLQEVLELREEAWFSRGVALSRTCNESIVNASIQCMRELRDCGTAHHQIIAAACSIDHAKSIRSLYSERGLEADVIHSELEPDKKDEVRRRLSNRELDAIVQVQMLGEGADYPLIGVAAVFRPFRHLVPYIQFIGRAMRVVREKAPGHPDNRGYVVSHVGLNVERWWDDLKRLDDGEQLFFRELAESSREFSISGNGATDGMRRYRSQMEVLEEVVERFVEVGFLEEARTALVEDVVSALALRGVELETLGIDREELAQRLEKEARAERTGRVFPIPVQPQKRRQEARRRLNERVGSAASEVLRVLGYSIPGYDLPRLFPRTGSANNVGAANVLINLQIQEHLGTRSAERDILSTEELEEAYRRMDDFVDAVVEMAKTERGDAKT